MIVTMVTATKNSVWHAVTCGEIGDGDATLQENQ